MNEFLNSITDYILELNRTSSLTSVATIDVYNGWAKKTGYIVPSDKVSYIIRYVEDVINIIKMAGSTPFERGNVS